MRTIAVAVALVALARQSAGQVVTLCPPPVGSRDAWWGSVTGLTAPETYIALLEISPDGGTMWDKTCG